MSLFSAIGKSVARYINNKHAESQRENAKTVVFKKVGKNIRKARKSGVFVNGSKLYRDELNKEYARIDAKQMRRDNFISDI